MTLQAENLYPPALLGTYAKFATTSLRNKRVERFWLQALARDLLPDERVSVCLRAVQPKRPKMAVMYSPGVGRSHYRGLIVCGRTWQCPVCAARITEGRRSELAAAIGSADLDQVMLTYTLQHSISDKLPALLAALLDSYRRGMKRGRAWELFCKRVGWVGSVRSLEVTYGDNGWHVHCHELVFLKRGQAAQLVDEASWLKHRWLSALAAAGMSASWERGLDVRQGDYWVREYVAKYGHEPIRTPWTLESELTKAPVKLGREGGRSPMQLLADYGLGDLQAGALYVEYVQAFKGRSQLTWSRGLRSRLGLGVEVSDDQLADEDYQDSEILAMLTREQWAVIVRNDWRGQLLEVADSGSRMAVEAFLTARGVEVA